MLLRYVTVISIPNIGLLENTQEIMIHVSLHVHQKLLMKFGEQDNLVMLSLSIQNVTMVVKP